MVTLFPVASDRDPAQTAQLEVLIEKKPAMAVALLILAIYQTAM